jgi:hypothetical protein
MGLSGDRGSSRPSVRDSGIMRRCAIRERVSAVIRASRERRSFASARVSHPASSARLRASCVARAPLKRDCSSGSCESRRWRGGRTSATRADGFLAGPRVPPRTGYGASCAAKEAVGRPAGRSPASGSSLTCTTAAAGRRRKRRAGCVGRRSTGSTYGSDNSQARGSSFSESASAMTSASYSASPISPARTPPRAADGRRK